MEKVNVFNRCMWLITTINAAGIITKERLDYLWSRSNLNSKGEKEYHERSFRRHRAHCAEMFGIEIQYNNSSRTYSISMESTRNNSEFQEWLLNSFSVQQLLEEVKHMSKRIVLEHIPSGHRFLTTILTAMSTSSRLEVSYQRFDRPEPHTFLLSPYCVKVFKQRWYVVGQSNIHDELRVYSLDRMLHINDTEEHFEMPQDFDTSLFFAPYYGVMCGTGTKSEFVRIKVEPLTAKYIRSLPLHHTQTEEEQTADYSVFNYYVAPTYDFIQELRTQGSTLEVLEPKWLREQFADEAKKLVEMYRL